MIFEILITSFCFILAFIVWNNQKRLKELEEKNELAN